MCYLISYQNLIYLYINIILLGDRSDHFSQLLFVSFFLTNGFQIKNINGYIIR